MRSVLRTCYNCSAVNNLNIQYCPPTTRREVMRGAGSLSLPLPAPCQSTQTFTRSERPILLSTILRFLSLSSRWTVSTIIKWSGFEGRSHHDGQPLGEVLPNLASENATGCGWRVVVGGGGGWDQAFPLKATAYTTRYSHIFSLLSLSRLLCLLAWYQRVPYKA